MLNPNWPKRCFIIAEVSANHGQDLYRTIKMIKEAKKCGVDAIKFQCYTPDTMTINCNNRYFKLRHSKWSGQNLYQLYKRAYMPWKWLRKLKKIADDCGIIFFATAFDKTSVDFLEELNVPFHKIASFELVDLPLIEYTAKTRKPLILSTGMARLNEIREALDTAKGSGAKDIILLKCVSGYPAKDEEMNLRTIPDMAKRFKLQVGLSDHTLGIVTSIAAVSLGAKVIEKHFTLSRRLRTLDNFFSIEPKELKLLVDGIRTVEKSLGKIQYTAGKEEAASRIFRRSLFIVRNMKGNEVISKDNIRSIRPGFGLHTRFYKKIIGKRITRSVSAGTPMRLGLVSPGRNK